MSVVVAATSQFLFKRNFNENRWARVGNNMCKVQVVEKGGAFYFKINDGNGISQFPLAKESKLHFSKEFVQVPLAESKALYGIKFSNPNDAENFYGKVVKKMGQSWCDQMTGVDSDNLPKPYSTYNIGGGANPPHGGAKQSESVAQSLPAHAQKQAPSVMGGGMPLRAGGGVRESPDSGMNASYGGYGKDYQSVRYPGGQGAGGGGGGSGGFPGGQSPGGGGYPGGQSFGGGYSQGQGVQRAGAGGHPGDGGYRPGDDRLMYNGDGRYKGQPQLYEQPISHAREPQTMGMYTGGGRGGPGSGGSGSFAMVGESVPPSASRPQQQQQPPPLPSRKVAWPEHQQQDSRIRSQEPSPTGGVRPNYQPHAPQQPQQQQQQRQQPPRPRLPVQLKPEDLNSVVKSLMDAINKRDKKEAASFLDALVSSDSSLGSVAMQLREGKLAEPEQNTFVLNIRVEFQQPEKKPLNIYLDDTKETDTIDVLKTKVQVKFFIPKASQHWIIGDTLISSQDMQKTLQQLGISGQHVREAKVFMYVMNAKKANVPKEEIETVRSNMQQKRRQQEQEQQGQGLFAQQGFPPNQNQISSSGPTGPASLSYAKGQFPDQNRGNMNRGYTGAPPTHYQGNDQRPKYAEDMSAYSQMSMQGGGPRGPGEFVTSNAPPPPNANFPGGPGKVERAWTYQPDRPDGFNRAGTRGHPPPSLLPQQQQHPQGNIQPPAQQGNIQAVLGILAQLQDPNAVIAKAPPPAPEPKKVGWVCQCTWLNPPRRPSCEMCLTDRPADYVVPDDAPVDEATRKAQESEKMMEEFMRREREEEARKAQENYRRYLDMDTRQTVANEKEFDCIICYTPVEPGEGVVLRNCLHEFCKDCLRETVKNSPDPEVKCPFDNGQYVCGAAVSEREIRAVVSEEELQELYKKGLRQAESAAANSFHCKTNDCEGFCFYEDEVNLFDCPICRKRNCLLCKAIHEGMDCKEYQDDLKRRAANDEAAKETQKMLEELVEKGDAMFCPQCKIIVQKKDGCDWIRCVMCKTEICWATKGPRWGPKGRGDTSGGCKCRVGGKKCTPMCRNCH